MGGSPRGDGKTVLLLGGYGRAGLAIAELLLEETEVRLLLAGRDERRAQESARRLEAGSSKERVEGIRVDASDASALEAAFRRCDLVTVCAPMTGIGRRVMYRALAAGIDYVGLNVETAEPAETEDLSDRIEQAGLRFITDAGLLPGVPAVLARWAAARFDRVKELTIGALLREPNLTWGSAVDIVDATRTPLAVYDGGEWHRPSLTESRSIDFGPPFGACSCYPMDLPELRALPDLMGLERAGAYVAGANGAVNAVMGAWYLLGLARFGWGVRLGATLLIRAYGRVRPPFGVILTVDTVGEVAGHRRRSRVAIQHEDGYVATAIPTVACLRQMIDGTLEGPGIRMMGHAVEVERFVGDMERLGLKPTETATRE